MPSTVSVACSSIPTCRVKSTSRNCCAPTMKCSANFSVAFGILYNAVDSASMSSRSSRKNAALGPVLLILRDPAPAIGLGEQVTTLQLAVDPSVGLAAEMLQPIFPLNFGFLLSPQTLRYATVPPAGIQSYDRLRI